MRSFLIAFQNENVKVIYIIRFAEPCNFIIGLVLLSDFKSYLLSTDLSSLVFIWRFWSSFALFNEIAFLPFVRIA